MLDGQSSDSNVIQEEARVEAENRATPEPIEDDSSFDEEDEQDEEEVEEVYEEPSQNESEDDTQATYQAKNEGIAAIGDNARVKIDSYIQIVQVFHQRPNESDEVKESGSDKQDDLIKQALAFAQQSNTFPVKPVTQTTDTSLPADDSQIASWYYKLDVHTQCYVQVAAILHGAPAHEISTRADTLYTRFLGEGDVLQNASPDKSSLEQRHEVRFTAMYGNRSSKELQKKTHTITQRIEGVERLFWEDVDIYGISSFGLRVLDFLAAEYTSQGIHGQNLLNILSDWSQENHAESSWRSAYALGVFLWHQNVDKLRREVIPLSKERSQRSRNRVASLLEGAYELESIKYPEKAANIHESSVLQLLHKWIENKAQHQTEVYSKCAAANTLERIGKRKPDIALAQLEQLLQEPPNVSVASTNALYASIIAAYVTLSRSGRMQSVLVHLARIAEQTVLQPDLPRRLHQRHEYRRRCEAMLQVVTKAFFIIVADSFSETVSIASSSYLEPLPTPPVLPDPQGRDVVLTGLLSETESYWRNQLISLLSAALCDRQSRLSALGVMQKWAETVLKMQEEHSDEATLLLASYKHFMIQIGKNLDAWSLDLKKRKGHLLETNSVYREQLKTWRSKQYDVRGLAADVLSQLKD